ncbi:MAG: SEC-C metal-binding domain-containing protein [Nitrospirota bacterium]|nr:SEC-C metal-binding domain-containing protein [Nitrospirota bacterium]
MNLDYAQLVERLSQTVDEIWQPEGQTKDQVASEFALAQDLRVYVQQHPGSLEQIESAIDADVVSWLLQVPWNLAKHKMIDEAVTVARGMGHLLDDSGFLSDAMLILAQADRGEEAITQFQANQKRWPEDAWVHILGGEMYEQLGQDDLAEQFYWQSLVFAEDDQYARDGVFERLLPLLDRLGREEEADTLIADDEARLFKQKQDQRHQAQFMEDLDRILPLAAADQPMEDELPLEPYVRALPKIGRNDPCPCGSGKKYKKCCEGPFQ